MCTTIISGQNYTRVYTDLQKIISEDSLRIKQKQGRIDSLKKIAAVQYELNQREELLDTYTKLGSECRLYHYREAFYYTRKAQEIANGMDRLSTGARLKSELGELLVSGGLYYEAIDTLMGVDVNLLSDESKINHYGYLMRAHWDLKTFLQDGHYEYIHTDLAYQYIDSARLVKKETSPELIKVKALYFLSSWQLDSAMRHFNYMIDYPSYSLQDRAVAHSCLGIIYGSPDLRNTELAKTHFAQAAINDFLLVNKEGQALIFLAEYLFNEGKLDEAYQLVQKAKSDAERYGSLMRRRQAANMLTKIEGQVLNAEMEEKLRLFRYLLVGIVIILAVIVLVIIFFRRVLNLRRIKHMLETHNLELNEVNGQLLEANKIKEKYIGQFFITNSEYIEKLNTISIALNNIIINKNTAKLSGVLRKIQPKKEQESFMRRFDELFVSLFPSFIDDVKALLKPDQEIVIKATQVLNTELRVFALIRIGIDQNEEISRILNISVNTVYSYKTKLKNKVDTGNEDLEGLVMKIPSV
jgi:hypothetical protein